MAYKREYQEHSEGSEAAWRQLDREEKVREAENKRWIESGAALRRVSENGMKELEADMDKDKAK